MDDMKLTRPAMVAITILRVVVGWHFLYEGIAKLTSPSWSAAGYMRLETFNLFNTVNYGTPNRFVNTPQFGTITEAATPARQIQFVVRATF